MSFIECSKCNAVSYNGPRVVLYCKSCYKFKELECNMLLEAYKELKEKYEHLLSHSTSVSSPDSPHSSINS